MSYASKEASAQDSAPIMLFEFVQGSTSYFLTSAATAITVDGHTWTPTALVCGPIVQSGEQPKDTLQVKIPISHALAATFLGYTPDVITTLTVWRTHYDDAGIIMYWKGRVVNTAITGNVMNLECAPWWSSAIGLRELYTRTCRHALFGAGCRLASTSFDTVASATAATGPAITIPDAAALDSLLGGTLKAPDGTIRMIVKHSGATVTLNRWIKSLNVAIAIAPTDVTVYPGCDKSPDTCHSKFANLANFGGWYIQTGNPMGGNDVF